MKKIILFLLSALMLFSLCSCAEIELPKPTPELTPEPVQTAEPAPDPTPEPEIVEFEEGNSIIVNINSTEMKEYAPDNSGKLILTFAYETPVVYIDGNDEAASVINDSLSVLDELFYSGYDDGDTYEDGFNTMLESAIDNYTYAYNTKSDIKLDFSHVRKADVSRVDNRVLSVVYTESTYSGDAHENYEITAYNFDTATGERITIDDLIPDMDAFKAFVADFIKEWMPDKAVELGVEEYTEIILGLIRDGSWYFREDGLCLVSKLYELGGDYSYGVYYFTVFNSYLEGQINDKYLPTEGVSEGAVEVVSPSELRSGMDILDKITAKEGGDTVYLVVDGTLIDVSVSEVDYSDNEFYKTGLLWASNYLKDCAIQLETVIPEGMPDLMICYRTSVNGVLHRMLLTTEGVGGKTVLVDDGITAVG